jgi:hypothetical protein
MPGSESSASVRNHIQSPEINTATPRTKKIRIGAMRVARCTAAAVASPQLGPLLLTMTLIVFTLYRSWPALVPAAPIG